MREMTEAFDQPPKRRRRTRFLRLAGICAVVFALGLAFIQTWPPGLNASERRFLGVWTWKEAPGRMTCHYQQDGTMQYSTGPSDTSPRFMSWKVDSNVISLESFERNLMRQIVKSAFSRRKQKPDQYPVTFNADGSITFALPDGTVKVLIPWSSDLGEIPEQAE